MTAGSDTANGAAISVTAEFASLRQPIDDGAPRRIGQRGEGKVEGFAVIVNHVVKYCRSGDVSNVGARPAGQRAAFNLNWCGVRRKEVGCGRTLRH